jgi:GDP-L-fucose synthase
MITKKSKIFLAGHNGMVGSAILREFKKKGYRKIITKNKRELNLLNQKQVETFIKKIKPHYVIIAAAKVGGILANQKKKADFIYENLMIQTNIIHSAHIAGVQNLIFLGSSCVYPKNSKQPIKEKYLLSGELEKTNDAYAIAKIAGIKMCESYNLQYKRNYRCLMPSNSFGPNDNYDLETSHFLPAMIRKVHEVKMKKKDSLIIWGNGKVKREMIYVEDVANACIFFMKKKTKETVINIGTGKDYSINDYVKKIIKIIKPNQNIKIKYDFNKPNGTRQKLLDVSIAKKYGWKSHFKLEDSISKTYQFFKEKN